MSERRGRTSDKAKTIFGDPRDDSLYQKRARAALPILVRQASVKKPITYEDLAKELNMPNPRNLNYVLGSIGNTLSELGEQWQEEIPRIQGLVLKKGKSLPGDGVHFFDKKMDPSEKEAIIEVELGEIFNYSESKWLDVLEALGLSPPESLNRQLEQPVRHRGGSAESEAHKRLKNYIAQHPEAVGLEESLAPGETEYKLRTGDTLDVLFRSAQCRIAVEVKSHISDEDDLKRGFLQCVKYRALLRACRRLEGGIYEADAILAIEGSLSKELISVKHKLGVKVFENIEIK